MPSLNHQKYIAQKEITIQLGKEDHIKDKQSKELLRLLDGETVEDTEVILEVKKEDPNNAQMWVKDASGIDRKDLADGWFKLKKLIADRF